MSLYGSPRKFKNYEQLQVPKQPAVPEQRSPGYRYGVGTAVKGAPLAGSHENMFWPDSSNNHTEGGVESVGGTNSGSAPNGGGGGDQGGDLGVGSGDGDAVSSHGNGGGGGGVVAGAGAGAGAGVDNLYRDSRLETVGDSRFDNSLGQPREKRRVSWNHTDQGLLFRHQEPVAALSSSQRLEQGQDHGLDLGQGQRLAATWSAGDQQSVTEEQGPQPDRNPDDDNDFDLAKETIDAE